MLGVQAVIPLDLHVRFARKDRIMLARIRTLTARRDAGASAVEYGLLVAAIAAVIITVVVLLGGQLNSIFTGVNDELGTIPGGTGGGVTTGG